MSPKQKGFTVVELIVVVVIIGILAAITIVSYGSSQRRAHDAALRSDLLNAGKMVSIWLAEPSGGVNTLLGYYTQYGGGYSSWITGPNADNALTGELRWSAVPNLPQITASKGSTLEIIGRYSGTAGTYIDAVNSRMRSNNYVCIAGAAVGSSYDYRPMSGIHSQYDRMLYFDGALGQVLTMKELVEIHQAGRSVTCEGHVQRYLLATP